MTLNQITKQTIKHDCATCKGVDSGVCEMLECFPILHIMPASRSGQTVMGVQRQHNLERGKLQRVRWLMQLFSPSGGTTKTTDNIWSQSRGEPINREVGQWPS